MTQSADSLLLKILEGGYSALLEETHGNLTLACYRLAETRNSARGYEIPVPTVVDLNSAAAAICSKTGITIPPPRILLSECKHMGLPVLGEKDD